MSKKRKTSKTGYTLFFEECKDSYVDEFRPKFLGPETLTKIREQANSQWNSMSQEKRRPYEMRAEELRSNVTKYNSLGVPILEQKKLEEDEKEKLKWMYDEIRQIVRNLFQMGPEYVLQEKFYFLHINCYVRTDVDGIVVPCEIALLEYSIKDGGTKVYHKFLRIRDIPSGYACASKEVLEKTHRIPLPPVELKPCVKHASEVYTHILQFLLGKEVGDAEPLNLAEIEQEISKIPLFCAKVEHEITKECLGAIVADSRMRAVPFMVFHLDYLLHQLASMSADWAMEKLLSEKQQSAEGSDDEVELTEKEKNRFCHFPEKEAAEMFINRELFDHAPEVACNFHEEQDNRKFCSRSWVKRWSFMVSDVVCMNMGVKMIENRHCQVRAKLSSSPQRGFGKNSKGRKPDKRAFQQSKTKRVSSGWVQPKSAPSEDDDYVPVTPAQSVSREAFLEGERRSRGQLRASTARLDMQQSFGGTGSRSPPSANVPAPQRDAAETRTVRATVNLPANESAPPGFAQHSGSRVTGVGRGGAPAHLSGNGTLPQSVGATAAAGHWDIPTRSTLAMQDRYRERLSSTRGSQPMERATSPTDSVSHRSLGSGLPRFLMESESEYAANSSRPSSAMSISAQSRASSAMSLATTGRTGVVPFTINPPRSRQEPRATTNRRRELPVEPQYFVDCNNEPVDISDDGPSLDNFNAVFRPGANVENAGQAALRRPLPMSVGGKPDTPPPPCMGHESDVSETRRRRSRSRPSSSPHGSHVSHRRERSVVSGSENSSRRRSSSRRRRHGRSASGRERSRHRRSSRRSSRHHRRSETERSHYRRGVSSSSRRHRNRSSSESSSGNSPTRFSSHRGSRYSQERPRLRRSESFNDVSGQCQNIGSVSSAFYGPVPPPGLRSSSPHAGHATPPVIKSCPPSDSQDMVTKEESKQSRSPSPMIVYDARYAGPIQNLASRRKTSTLEQQEMPQDIKPNMLDSVANSTEHTTRHASVLPGMANIGTGPENMEPIVPTGIVERERQLDLVNDPHANSMHPLPSLQHPPRPVPPPTLQVRPQPVPPPTLQHPQPVPLPAFHYPPQPVPPPALQYPPQPVPPPAVHYPFQPVPFPAWNHLPQPVPPPALLQQLQGMLNANMAPPGPQLFPTPPLDENQYLNNNLPPVPAADPFIDDEIDYTDLCELMVVVKNEAN